ncbi:MAG: hypothetical protein U9N73_07510 [Candidatus Auribacterota bacterium]|nr:hypothetical protein [Candidatus Auribacterota bacterium]
MNVIRIGLPAGREVVRFRFLIGGALLVSLLFHIIIIGGLNRIPLFSPGIIVIEPPELSVQLEFVDSPKRIMEVEQEPDTNLISDRTSLAQDMIPDKTDLTDSPRSVGTVEEKSIRKSAAGEPGTISAPPRETKPSRAKDNPIGEIGSNKKKIDSHPVSSRPGEVSPIPGQGGDKYYAPEAESPEGKTRILKQVAYNVRSTEVGKYLARMKPRVVNLWQFNVMNNTFFVRSTRTHILIKIMPDGSLDKVVVNEHQGPDMEMRYSLNAVEHGQPYEPLNQKILDYIQDDGLWIEFHFRYH